MPEIPFIETLVATLSPRVEGRTITGARLLSASLLKTVDPPLADTEGRTIEGVARRGKLVLLALSEGITILVHLMRDGRLAIVPSGVRAGKDVALLIRLERGEELRLVENGPKKRAALYVRRTAEVETTEPVAGLGLDPLGPAFTPQALAAMLDATRTDRGPEGDEEGAGELPALPRRVQLKRFLTLQRYLAGIGNAYADEILWEARLSPFSPVDRVGEERGRLFDAIRDVLTRAVDEHRNHFAGRLPTREPVELLRVHRHAGEPCPRCGGPIAAVYYAEKETYYCPACQTGGKVYADRRLSRLLR